LETLTLVASETDNIVIHADAKGDIEWINAAFTRQRGYTYDELRQARSTKIQTINVNLNMDAIIKESIDKNESVNYEHKHITKQGKEIYLSSILTPIFDDRNKIKKLIIIEIDITERKHAEEALKESETKYCTLVEQAKDIVIIVQDGCLKFVNKSFLKLTGYSESEIEDLNILDLVTLRDREILTNHYNALINGEMSSQLYETKMICKDQSAKDVEISAVKIQFNGKPAMMAIIRDLTERKKIEEELFKASKLESIGTLAGGIAHDFNNILTGIMGNISLAKLDAESDSSLIDILTEVEKASQRAKDLTQQLLTFSKGGAPIRKTASIAEIIKDSADFILSGSNARCQFDFRENLLPVKVDPGQISQVIQNLIVNASQAMPEGGIINVCVDNHHVTGDCTLQLNEGEYVKITIEDHGMGIPQEYLPKIFDPYFTTKQNGSGLGLATAYSIIKKHDGIIDVRSKLGTGTTFEIYLPASTEKFIKKEKKKLTSQNGKGKILIMDDEVIVQKTAGMLLTRLGFTVEFAHDGKEAITLYKKAKVASEPFDAVIMDLTIRGGMGGKETIEKLRQIDPEVKAIVSSGFSNDPIMADFKKYGFFDVIAKPYRIENLSETLNHILSN